MSCGEPAWWHEVIGLDEEPTPKEYVDNAVSASTLKKEDITVSAAMPEFNLHLSGEEGVVWQTPDGNVNVTEEVVRLREEVNMLKSFIDDFMGDYRVKEFTLNDVSLVKEGGHPIQESKGEKYDRAMKGI